jgi:hypothetical protein
MSEPTELSDRAEVKDGHAIVAYSYTEAALAELRKKYAGATYDLATTAGDKAARTARLELVTLRTALEKKRKELKTPALDFGKKIDSEAARITTEIQALETPIDAQIKADEKRRDDERKAREEADAARKKVHTDAIAKIAGYVGLAADLPAERIAAGITYLEGIALSGFEEFSAEAADTRSRTIAALQVMHTKAKAREEEEARLAAERIEQARVAEEQAAIARKLQADREDLARQQAALVEESEKLQRAQEEQARQAAQAATPAPTTAPVQIAQPATAPQAPAANSPNVVPMGTRAPAAAKPTLRLGQINERIAPLQITVAGLEALGFKPAAKEGAAVLFQDADFPAMVDSMVASLRMAQEHQKQAA